MEWCFLINESRGWIIYTRVLIEAIKIFQVHLICMPPNGDITCKKSSQYHFVNEYLYKPLNLDEAESKPNVTLRYSERYFPSDIYTDERESNEYHRVSHAAPARRPVSFISEMQHFSFI